ncbi:hypothetical protein B0T10DRAFT_568059 [Thelonectria olida]|uniref:Uncharacterized protein n=1 Tax=Thelonectria olida TaxID=1576542 RepID=A0A9P9AF78_9HYPO|nr:hypothetical protein B0T10DRAFT_568059 [Thelonectria olida]
MLSLFLLDGEIIHNGLHRRIEGMRGEAVSSFLKAQAFDAYYTPHTKNGLTFNKGCRFINAEFTEQGIKTWGHLWELSEVIKTSGFSRKLPFQLSCGGVGMHQSSARSKGFGIIASTVDLHSGSAQSFANAFQQTMAAEVVDAIDKGKDLRLAHLWGSQQETSASASIFIWDEYEEDEKEATNKEKGTEHDWKQHQAPTYVFTASKLAENKRLSMNDLDRHVSLEVDCYLDSSLRPE